MKSWLSSLVHEGGSNDPVVEVIFHTSTCFKNFLFAFFSVYKYVQFCPLDTVARFLVDWNGFWNYKVQLKIPIVCQFKVQVKVSF